jgi:hypothetical protein
VRFISEAFVEPGFEVVAQHVLVEEVVRATAAHGEVVAQVVERPDGKRIVGGDEAERLRRPSALQPARQQHAERLVRQPALEGIGDQ